jgi:putative heme iron utilization protein
VLDPPDHQDLLVTDTTAYATGDHQVSGEGPPPPPPPLTQVPATRRRTAGEEARTLVAQTNVATLATLSDDGMPWASLVSYAALEDGSPVLLVSTLAEHGRNLERDPRASLVVASAEPRKDPLAAGRVTLAGRVARPSGETEAVAREAYLAGVPTAKIYAEFGDFSFYVLEVDRVRWVGGYGRMDSADAESYANAQADPVGEPIGAIKHLNDDHADALLIMAQALGGYPDAETARCTTADRYGLDLMVGTPRGSAPARVGFAEPVTEPAGLRAATVELTRRARATA